MTDQRPIKRALVSVSDKTGLIELATALSAAGVEIVSTGSTASTVAAAGNRLAWAVSFEAEGSAVTLRGAL